MSRPTTSANDRPSNRPAAQSRAPSLTRDCATAATWATSKSAGKLAVGHRPLEHLGEYDRGPFEVVVSGQSLSVALEDRFCQKLRRAAAHRLFERFQHGADDGRDLIRLSQSSVALWCAASVDTMPTEARDRLVRCCRFLTIRVKTAHPSVCA